MHIIYAVTTCSDAVYKQLFAACPVKPAFQSQKYHRLLIEGLAHHTDVDVVATLPINRENCAQKYLRLPEETEGGARYHYVPSSCLGPYKHLLEAIGVYSQVKKLCRKDSVVFVDCLNCTTALFAQLAARQRGCRCVGIVTDLPEMLYGSGTYTRLTSKVINRCTDYVFLTEQMNARLNPENKPYIVLEGHADITMAQRDPQSIPKASPRVCLYAGSVCKLYGLETLVRGFQMAHLPDAKLMIYGPGDYVEELKAIAAKDPNIEYGGMLLSSQVVEKEMESTLLINPRPTGEEYVKYSFPSKTMEYMASGTPVLTTRLPGMPKEYYPYVNLIEEENPEGIARALASVFSRSEENLHQQGLAARRFVLEERNNLVQAEKILEKLRETERS